MDLLLTVILIFAKPINALTESILMVLVAHVLTEASNQEPRIASNVL
jgi:hypothetical protein